MKIVNLTEFRKLPAGTIYSKYEPCVFYDLMCKQETIEVDFFYSDLVYNVDCSGSDDKVKICGEMEAGESRPLDFDSTGRDGTFNDDQLFAIYEKKDIEQFIDKFNRCIEEAY